MNKEELVKTYAQKFNITKREASEGIYFILESIKKAVKKGEKVSLGGFGTFSNKKMKAKKVRNPRTGELVKFPSYRKVKFAISQTFKEFIR